MGLIKAGIGAIGGTLADQWKDFFCYDALDNDVMVAKGQKRVNGRSSNSKGNSNIISNGSGISVADGQCMMIVEQGKIVELCAEPGVFTYNNTLEPSIFTGNLGESMKDVLRLMGSRFAYGGGTGEDQRIYYFNTKEIIDNKFGTQNPIPFRVVDSKIGLDIDVSVRCNGVYSFKIVNPILFYTNVCGNVDDEYLKEEIAGQLKTEFISALQPALAKISAMQIRPSDIPAHVEELSEAMNEALTKKWSQTRGLEVVSIALNAVTLPAEDADIIKKAQESAVLRDPTMAAATLASAQAEAMRTAASNESGAMTGFMGMGMAAQAGGVNAQSLFEMGAKQQTPETAQPVSPQTTVWKCECGAKNTGKFCEECGRQKPTSTQGWACSCGTMNKGKFCMECGKPKPAGAPLYRCDKCGWEPEDPHHPPKFCPECGDIFDDNDIK